MAGRLTGWLFAWLPSRRNFRVITVVDAADEIPEHLPSRGATLVGTAERPTWIAFDCPCEAHHRVMLNLDRSRRPAWAIASTSRLTISPSIDERRPGKRCHYFIRDGRVQWRT
jgi:Family of unknown function (DUF6527)